MRASDSRRKSCPNGDVAKASKRKNVLCGRSARAESRTPSLGTLPACLGLRRRDRHGRLSASGFAHVWQLLLCCSCVRTALASVPVSHPMSPGEFLLDTSHRKHAAYTVWSVSQDRITDDRSLLFYDCMIWRSPTQSINMDRQGQG